MERPGINAEQYEALMNVVELRGINPAWPKGLINHVLDSPARTLWMSGNPNISSMVS